MHVRHGNGRDAFPAALRSQAAVADGLDDRPLLAASRRHGWTVGAELVHLHLGPAESDVETAVLAGTGRLPIDARPAGQAGPLAGLPVPA
jgi:hypothetical protein